jgi:hypothetical protein
MMMATIATPSNDDDDAHCHLHRHRTGWGEVDGGRIRSRHRDDHVSVMIIHFSGKSGDFKNSYLNN